MTRLAQTELEHLSPLSDQQIVERILGGDIGSFELLMRRYNQRLFIAARSVLKRDSDAEDALQESYLRAYRSLGSFEGRSSVSTWLTRITLNEALRIRKRNARRAQLETADHAPKAGADRDPNMFATIPRDENQDRLQEAMDALNDNERTVVMLRLIHGLSTREVAQSTGLSQSNVKVTLHRARLKLADNLTRASCAQLKQELAFDGARCDRIVDRVFARLNQAKAPDQGTTDHGL